jgi:hypothetical protein
MRDTGHGTRDKIRDTGQNSGHGTKIGTRDKIRDAGHGTNVKRETKSYIVYRKSR